MEFDDQVSKRAPRRYQLVVIVRYYEWNGALTILIAERDSRRRNLTSNSGEFSRALATIDDPSWIVPVFWLFTGKSSTEDRIKIKAAQCQAPWPIVTRYRVKVVIQSTQPLQDRARRVCMYVNKVNGVADCSLFDYYCDRQVAICSWNLI